MLLSRRRGSTTTNYDTTSVHNYYERLVTESIIRQDPRAGKDYDFLADVSCVALNHLPPRYIRHDVDMTFYMSPVELEEVHKKVNSAVKHALEFVNSREQEKLEESEDTEH
ncbi:MAG: late competence development ComFB family protein [Cellvibrionaceae bacterium]